MKTKWTRFEDTHTGGRKKLDWEVIYIRGDRDLAIKKFENTFDIYPLWASCECCGEDYRITEQDDDPQDHEHDDVLVIDTIFG